MNDLNHQVSELLGSQRAALAERMVSLEFVRHPELERRYGKVGREKCLEDVDYHLIYLAQAISVDKVELFVDYIGWAKVMLAKHGVPEVDLAGMLETMKESLRLELPSEFSPMACDYLRAVLRQLPQMPDDVPSCMAELNPLAPLAWQYLQALLRGERHVASKLVLDTVQHGTPVRDLYLHVFQPALYEVGRLWMVNQISVAQEHYCTAATQLIISQLYPYILGGEKKRGTLVATCVSGDLHEIGLRMVTDFFEMDGWQTHYLGANVPTSSVVQILIQYEATVLAISATITYHVRAVELLIEAVRRAPECRSIKILVGGYPFKVAPDLWRKVGADGFAADAQEAIILANRLTNQQVADVKLGEASSVGGGATEPEAPGTGRPEVCPTEADLPKVILVAKDPTSFVQAINLPDHHLYEEITRTNNELANLQREVVCKNSELAAEQEKLKRSEHRYRSLSACSPLGILEMNADGRCLYTNPHWQVITGLTADESLDDGWQRVLDPRDATTFLNEWNQALRKGLEFSREVRLVITSGEQRWAQVRSRSILAEHGEVVGQVSTVEEITERKQAETALENAHKDLVNLSRQAGMAEVAISVLHNVGNVLNSVSVASSCMADNLRRSKSGNLSKVVKLMNEHETDWGPFFTSNPKGKLLPGYLAQLAGHLAGEQSVLLTELAGLQTNIEHIKDIVTMQQSYVKVSGVSEILKVSDLVEDALRMSASILARNDIRIIKEFEEIPSQTVERNKALQIMINLVRNAEQACDESGHREKILTLRVTNGRDCFRIAVSDNGIGIPVENLSRIFGQGFTTKKNGHGFGLHSSALAAKEMGGSLTVHSDGPGLGATFTLELPYALPDAAELKFQD